MIEHVDQKMFESLVATGHARGVLSLDEVEAILGGDCSKLIVGGAHQGGSVAMHVAMGTSRRAKRGQFMNTGCHGSVDDPSVSTVTSPTGGFP